MIVVWEKRCWEVGVTIFAGGLLPGLEIMWSKVSKLLKREKLDEDGLQLRIGIGKSFDPSRRSFWLFNVQLG